MNYNCFFCRNVKQECWNERRYISYSDEEYCLNRTIADQDLARLKIGDFDSIILRNMLAQYLFDIGEKEKALKVLPVS